MNTLVNQRNLYKMIGFFVRKFFISAMIITILFFVTGCEDRAPVTEKPENKTSSQVVKSYSSISEYGHMITGENFKTGILDIIKKNDYVYLNMNFSLSPELKEIMLKTKSKFYFNFTFVSGNDNFKKVIVEAPTLIEGNLTALKDAENFLISQEIKIKHDISAMESKEILSPDSYRLEVLDENGQLVAVTVGLDINMIF